MSLILNIDTAIEGASLCLAYEGKFLSTLVINDQKDQAARIHTTIKEIMDDSGYSLRDLKAVAVTNGPGSYTGLRVGLSTAKGICYALQIPLITMGTLEMMAVAATKQLQKELTEENNLLCPMIDARRMEVYTAIYGIDLTEVMKPQAMILHSDSFLNMFQKQNIIFFGNGSKKFRNILLHPKAIFVEYISPGAQDMSGFTFQYFKEKRFADLAYTEPLYLKDFFAPQGKLSE